MEENNRFYVYVYLDPRKPGTFDHGGFCFPFEPIYVGKGARTRAYYFSNRNKILSWKIKKFGKPVIVFAGKKLLENEAFALEKGLIGTIGRIIDRTGTLCNLTGGGEGLFGFTHTDETKEKIGAANKGKPSWNKNGTMTQDWKNKIGAKNRGRLLTDEHKKKLSDAHKGKPAWNKGLTGVYSEEARKRMCASRTGKKPSPETRERMSTSHTGKTHSAEARKKISASRTGKKSSLETRKKISASKTGKKCSLETREKMSAAHLRNSQKQKLEGGGSSK